MSTDLSAPPAALPPGIASMLDDAWHGLLHDPAGAAAYGSALRDLGPVWIEATIASLRSAGAAPPSPGVLRTLVLARQRSGTVPAVPAAGAPPAADAPRVDPGPGMSYAERRRLVLPAAICAGLGLVTLLAALMPWVSVGVEGIGSRSWSGWDVGHAKLAMLGAVAALMLAGVAAVAAAKGLVGPARIALGLATVGAVGAAFRTFRWWSEAGAGEREVLDAFGGVDPSFVALIHVDVGSGAWVALAAAVLAAIAGKVGLWRLHQAEHRQH